MLSASSLVRFTITMLSSSFVLASDFYTCHPCELIISIHAKALQLALFDTPIPSPCLLNALLVVILNYDPLF
jgi:hypothetical protein